MLAEIETRTESFDFTVEEQNIKLVFLASKRKKTKKINLLIEGNFSLANAALVNEKVIPALESFDHLDIVLKNINQIDLAAIQLLYTLKKTQAAIDKTVTIDAELSKEDRSVLFNSGLMGLLSKTKLTD